MLQNLNELVNPISEKLKKFNVLDCPLPSAFTENVKIINKCSIEYGHSASCVVNRNGQRIFLSNNWFYIAAILEPLNKPFHEYKSLLLEIVDKDVLKQTDTERIRHAINSRKGLSDQDKEYLLKFALEPLWWNGGNSNTGGKTLDRGDALVSAVLSIANLVNNSQSYVATLWEFFGDNPEYARMLAETADDLIQKDTKSHAYDDGSVFKTNHNFPVQIIYFGSPGTGKSHEVATYLDKLIDNGKLKKENIFRTTFHPDYDFASFVGTYKPMTNGDAIRYEFEPQVFTEAYVKAWKDTNEQVYLVIEEINRGNCAQIFGDLFQLLDRKNGFSEYPIKADASLRKYLEREDVLGNDSDGINDGKLKLPANFNIIATMNTSDQSLFPMDSAFKRRWNWKYVPTKIVESEHKDRSLTVCNPDKDSDVLVNYNFKSRKLKLDQYEYNWSAFLQKVNSKIFEVTRSDDKKLGFWFLKPQAQNSEDLSVSDFVSKVVFYLWSDVFKDVGPKASNPFTITDKDGKMTVMSFNQFFDENTGQENIGVIHTFMGNLGLIPDFNEEIVDALDVSASSATQSENIIENQNE